MWQQVGEYEGATEQFRPVIELARVVDVGDQLDRAKNLIKMMNRELCRKPGPGDTASDVGMIRLKLPASGHSLPQLGGV
jgi:hypothetical protein